METELEAVNGRRVRAIEVFAHALHFFREHALKVHYKTPLHVLRRLKMLVVSPEVLFFSGSSYLGSEFELFTKESVFDGSRFRR